MAVSSNLYVDQGTDFTAIVNLQNISGGAFDLSNYSLRAQMRKNYTSTTYIEFTTIISDAFNGVCEIRLSPSDTDGLRPGRYVYDVEAVSPQGTVYRVVEGIVEIIPNVTR